MRYGIRDVFQIFALASFFYSAFMLIDMTRRTMERVFSQIALYFLIFGVVTFILAILPIWPEYTTSYQRPSHSRYQYKNGMYYVLTGRGHLKSLLVMPLFALSVAVFSYLRVMFSDVEGITFFILGCILYILGFLVFLTNRENTVVFVKWMYLAVFYSVVLGIFLWVLFSFGNFNSIGGILILIFGTILGIISLPLALGIYFYRKQKR
ncbi:MAG: hypothetical protein INQ03_10455 [Candidatus Heimdallarchaeota archaeon]|nr:hypothetical protein [Candidatus Heimdallarchaeota archaeon]